MAPGGSQRWPETQAPLLGKYLEQVRTRTGSMQALGD